MMMSHSPYLRAFNNNKSDEEIKFNRFGTLLCAKQLQ